MGKIAIVTDSNSGITQKEAKELGIHVLPMPFNMNDETYFEDVNLTRSKFYERLKEGDDISTSQPSTMSVIELWKELLNEYDEVLHIPMSSGLSGSCESAIMSSKKFDDKVKVVDNRRISVTLRQSVLEAMELVRIGKTAEEVKGILEAASLESSVYIMVDTLKYLRKGGRITPAVAAMGTLLRIKPILQIQGGKLDTFAKARTLKQAKSVMLEALEKDMETKFDAKGDVKKNVWIHIAHTDNEEEAGIFRKEVSEYFTGYEEKDIYTDHLSLSVACHIGPGSLAIACTKKLDVNA